MESRESRKSREPRRANMSGAAKLSLCVAFLALASLGTASSLAAAPTDEFVVFTWGGQFRILDHQVDFEGGRMKLLLGAESFMVIPLDSVSKILDINREVVLDFSLSGATMDPWDPPDASLWSPIQGWSGEEVWRPRGSHPRWAFRWTDAEIAWAVVPPPAGEAEALELRLMSIRHAMRVLGEAPPPAAQSLRVTLNGQFLGELRLEGRGWHTYRLELPDGCHEGPGFLELEASYLASPAEFTNGLSRDSRNLGVAVDYVRFAPSGSAGLPQEARRP